MNRAQVIQLIEHELVQADEATNEQQFETYVCDSYINVNIC